MFSRLGPLYADTHMVLALVSAEGLSFAIRNYIVVQSPVDESDLGHILSVVVLEASRVLLLSFAYT